MNIEELAEAAASEGFRADSYDLEGAGANETYVLRAERGLWSVFYAERGHEISKRTFTSESVACRELLSRLRADPTTKKR